MLLVSWRLVMGEVIMIAQACLLAACLLAAADPPEGSADPQPGRNAVGQPVFDKLQPDKLNVGTIYVGATVEASVRLFFKGGDATRLRVSTQAPPFVAVTQTSLGTENYGMADFIFCDVFVSFDTREPGAFNDAIEIKVGETQVAVPVAREVSEAGSGLTRVLIAETPIQRFSTMDASVFDPWLALVKSAKLDVSYLEVDRQNPVLRDVELSKFDIVLLAGEGVIRAQEGDFRKLKTFVYRGGRLIVTANAFFRNTVEKANEFVTHYGLKVNDVDSNLIGVGADCIVTHPLTTGVRALKFHRASPVVAQAKDRATVLVRTPSDPEAGYVAVARAGKGDVVVLGESLWWSWTSSQLTAGADNEILLKNLLVRR
jgi:hypothetical protein